ncbi:MAG: PD-(D/E)XK nuclease family protein [Lachnospiraceae bacterium]|nr:PD-(D/E)XK nuclease family protein [Lachnospiraceae bacterium]
MSLHFVLGPAGSGKTKYLFETAIREADKDPETMYYFLVPEQFSLQTQHDLLEVHPRGGILNIDVTSMARLANAAFAKLSGLKHEFIPEIGKSLIIKKVLYDNSDKLVMYGRNSRHAGFVAEAKALLSELLQYGITEEDLKDTLKITEKEPVLKRKLQDVITLVSGFKTCLGNDIMTNESMYDAFADILEKSGLAKNAVFILDGFTGFTPSQNGILKEVLRLGKEVYVSFTIDEVSSKAVLPEYDIYHMSSEAVMKLTKLADEVGCDVKAPVFTKYNKYETETLHALERGLFRHGRGKAASDGSLVMYNAQNIEEETKRAAAEAERLVRVDGYRYSDIAIVCGDIDLYGERICNELKKVNARFFLDRKKTLHENECSGFLEIILKLMEKGADTDLLISYAKNSLSETAFDDACILENYCNAFGLKGSAFKREFKREFYGRQDISLDKVNAVRKALIGEVSGILKVKKSTAKEFCDKLQAFLEKLGIKEKLETIAADFEKKEEFLKAKEYSSVYDALIDILDQTREFLGDSEMTAAEYRGLIEAGLSEAKVGLVPHGSDNITIGDIERTRLSNVKALFLLGANENKLPKPVGGKALISENDKKSLLNKGIELSPSHLKKAGNDKFYIYLTLTKPTSKLWISYPSSNGNDRLKPAFVLSEIAELYTDLKVIKRDDLEPVTGVLENDFGLRTSLSEERAVNERKLRTEDYIPERITKEEARGLYGEKLTGSISRLETFAECPFKHFLNYGLVIRKNETYKLQSSDFGDISHRALELYGKRLKESGKDWVTVPAQERETLIRECAMEAVDAVKSGVFADTSKNRYITERIKDALTLTVEMFTEQLKDTDFRPYAFEKTFKLSREKFTLQGKIDRIDTCETEDLKAVKVVDYKSGKHDFDYEKLYYGLSLQLPTYLNVATELLSPPLLGIENLNAAERVRQKMLQPGGYRPGAMLYDIIGDTVIDDKAGFAGDSEESRAAIRNEITKAFRTKGLVNDDQKIIIGLDHAFGEPGDSLKESVSSLKIPVTTNKQKGPEPEFKKGSKTISERRLRLLMEYAVDKMGQGAEKIMDGDVAVTPVKSKKTDACSFCDFKNVCGFDPRNGGKVMHLKKYETEELIEKMTGGESEDGGI